MRRSPSFRFYASDFLGSPTVALMDALEVGAYILLLCTAWENDRHGYLPDDDDRLRRWARLSREQWAGSRDLVLSKFPVIEDEPGWRCNPRMVTEAAKQREYSESRSENGRKGGRPRKHMVSETELHNAQKHQESEPSKHMVKSEKHVLFSEKHMPSKKKLAVTVTDTNKRHTAEADVCELFTAVWNENCGLLSKVTKLTDTRRKKLRARFADGLTLEHWRQVIQDCLASPFLRGDVAPRHWKVSFDYLIENDTHYVEILEGKYAPPPVSSTGSLPRSAADKVKGVQAA